MERSMSRSFVVMVVGILVYGFGTSFQILRSIQWPEVVVDKPSFCYFNRSIEVDLILFNELLMLE